MAFDLRRVQQLVVLGLGAAAVAATGCGGGGSKNFLDSKGGGGTVTGGYYTIGGYSPSGGYSPMGGYLPSGGASTGGVEPTGGYTTDGGTSNAGEGGRGGAIVEDPCPPSRPRGGSCEETGVRCTYPACCDTVGTAIVYCNSELQWVLDDARSSLCGACPETAPTEGAECSLFTCDNLEGAPREFDCAYASDCDTDDVARCVGNVWEITPGCAGSL